MPALAPVSGAICASCRLRAVIHAKHLARCGRPALQQSSRSLHSRSWLYQKIEPSRSLNEESSHDSRPDQTSELEQLDGIRDADNSDPSPILSEVSRLSPEDKVFLARQHFGDVLPEGLLNEEEYKIYERLYGTPIAREESSEALDEGEEIREEEAGTGVLRQNEDGELEEVELEPEELLDDGLESQSPDEAQLALNIESALSEDQMEEDTEDGSVGTTVRSHPFTIINRFQTRPSTINLPKDSLVLPVTHLLSGMPTVHLGEAAHRIFGGVGLPYSASTPGLARTMQPKPIALDAYQGRMTDIEGDSFLSVLYPAMYATTASILVETRKRLGTEWGENLVRKAQAGELRILDAGAGGAGIIAVREVLRAEWERMHERQSDADASTAVAQADGRVGGVGASPPLGHATVLTGSDVLRRRASQLLEDTTFIPRLPDYVHTETAKDRGKFDIIIAPHTLWSLKEDYLRKVHVQNLWSLLSVDGGVLLMIEKGVPRGFELIAGAREMLLDTRIAPPGSNPTNTEGQSDNDVQWEDGAKEPLDDPVEPKDKGMIIAPCTNHETCPMYERNGIRKGRKDICHFEQRYIRPGFLQKIIGAKDKNHEDIKFSYLSIMRGRDLRRLSDVEGQPEARVLQDEGATERAFAGYEEGIPLSAGAEEASALPSAEDFFAQDESEEGSGALNLGRAPQSLSLPRSIKPPLKRRGHVILDVCTPAGTLERWTVPKSFSKQAFRDARKSKWGDLWALGAKTRVSWSARSGTNMPKNEALDVEGHVKGEVPVAKGGQMRGRKVKGIRDKRDKKGTGSGRRKRQGEEY